MREMLAPGIFMIFAEKAQFPFCHCLLVEGETRGLVDTGAGKKTLSVLAAEGMDLVINSHYHRDHTVGNDLFQQAAVLIHRLDHPPLADKESRDFYTGFYKWKEVMGSERMSMLHGGKITPAPFIPARINGFVQDGQSIDFGGVRCRVLHTPGHTPGHCAFFFEREGIMYGGDIDLAASGPWYGDNLSSLDDFQASIRLLADIDPAVYCSAHRRPVKSGVAAELQKYLDVINERDQAVARAIREPLTLDELAAKGIIFSSHKTPYLLFWEKQMLRKHLERMLRSGQAVLEDETLYRLAAG